MEPGTIDNTGDHFAHIERLPQVIGHHAIQFVRIIVGILWRLAINREPIRTIEILNDVTANLERVLIVLRIVIGHA